jgi:hypothetical protein
MKWEDVYHIDLLTDVVHIIALRRRALNTAEGWKADLDGDPR